LGPEPWYESKALIALVSLVLGVLLGPYAEWLKRKFFRPKPVIIFDPNGACICETPVNWESKSATGDLTKRDRATAKAVRILVKNDSDWAAKACQAYLTDVSFREIGGAFTSLLDESLPLKWSYQDSAARTLTAHFKLYCDLASASDYAEQLGELKLATKEPLRWKEHCRKTGVYRFEVVVAAENVRPVHKEIYVKWDGDWSKLEGSETDFPNENLHTY
jgi:hypothetical protein